MKFKRAVFAVSITLWMVATKGASATEKEIRIGVQRAAFPFAFQAPDGSYLGYSVDLCTELVKRIQVRNRTDYPVRWIEISSKTRLVMLLAGRIHLECGSTSATKRRQEIGIVFSPTIFVSDVAVLLAPEVAQKSLSLRGWVEAMQEPGRVVVTTNGSTSVGLLRQLQREGGGRGIRVVLGADHQDSFNRLLKGEAHAFVMDRVLLASRLATHSALKRHGFIVSTWSLGEKKDSECYAIAMRYDVNGKWREDIVATLAELDKVVLYDIYERWFNRPLPRNLGFGDTDGEVRLENPMREELADHLSGLRAKTCTEVGR